MRLVQARRLSRMGDASTGYEKQEETAARYAEVHQHEIVATADDTNISGSRDPFTRPKLGPILANPELYDGLIASVLDRFGRNARHLHALRNWAEDKGRILIVVSPSLRWPPEPGDLASPIIWDVLARLAEYELSAITQRNKETQAWLHRNGYLVGKAMFGFKIIPHPDNPKHKTLTPDQDVEDVVWGMVNRALADPNFESIARWLNQEGISSPQGGLWVGRSVSQVLRNPMLIGRRTTVDHRDGSGRTLLKVNPILDMATWKRLQKRIERRPSGRPIKSDAMLAGGLLYCLACRRVMHHRKTTTKLKSGETRVYYFYRCDGTAKAPSTCRNSIKRSELDSWVSGQFIGEAFGDREIIEQVTLPGASHEDEVEQVTADIRELADRYAEEEVSDEEFTSKMAVMRAERTRLRDLPRDPDQTIDRPTGVTVAQRWAELDSLGRRQYLRDAGVTVFAQRTPGSDMEVELHAESPEKLWLGVKRIAS